jgi:uncharacterized cupin superfamily protein
MRKLLVILIIIAAAAVAISAHHDEAVIPAKISKEDIAGRVFERSDMVEMERFGTNTLDVVTLMSSDKKFASGVYKAGKHQAVSTEEDPYGVDEFLYMVEGNLTLTSSDGTVQEFGPGDAVTIPKEWTGVADTDGFVQLWVIYSEDGSGLE